MKLNNDDMEKYFTSEKCTRCILPETFPGIKFDQSGVCNYCDSYKNIEVNGEQELQKRLSGYRNRGDKYDCIVPISGGRTAALFYMKLLKSMR